MLALLVLLACVPAPPAPPPTPGAVALAYPLPPDEPELAEHLARASAMPDDADAWAELAVALLQRARSTGQSVTLQYAEDAAAAALANDPGQRRALQVRVRVLHDRHRFRQAADLAAEALERWPDDPTLIMLLGDALLELGAYDPALEAFQRAIDLRPDLRSYDRGAWMRWLYGDLDGAIDLTVRAIGAGGPGLPEPTAFCLVDLAHLQLRAGRPAAAIDAADAALALVPDYGPALATRARAHVMGGDETAAIADLERREAPPVSDVLLLADLYERTGRPGPAHDMVRRAEQGSDPRALARHLALRGREPGRALQLARAAQAERPTIDNLDTYALALLRAGHPAEAAAASDRAVALGTADARLYLHHALISASLGRLDEATGYLDRARALNPLEEPEIVAEIERTRSADPGR